MPDRRPSDPERDARAATPGSAGAPGARSSMMLLTNDDGVHAEGLATLGRLAESFGEAVTVAPATPQSGVGHAVTTERHLRLEALAERRYSVDGTPADCARVALAERARRVREALGAPATAEAPPVWVLSGINHGANLGVDVYVSGTAAAAREAAILGHPAIAISQYVGRHRVPDWGASLARARPVLAALLERPPAPGSFWNVNLPHPPDERVDCEIVYCEVDPSPHAIEYHPGDGGLAWRADFHARPRLPRRDIDVCFRGAISVSLVHLAVSSAAPPEPPSRRLTPIGDANRRR